MHTTWHGAVGLLLVFIGGPMFPGFLPAQQLIALQHLGSTSVYEVLDVALQDAQSGDTLMLPGGDLVLPANGLLINKSVHLIGAGYRPDSSATTLPTRLIGDVNVAASASGGSLQGLAVQEDLNLLTTLSNFSILRCRVAGLLDFADNVTQTTLRESYIHRLDLGYSKFTYIDNCVFLFQLSTATAIFSSFTNATVSNCVIQDGIFIPDGLTFRNCIIDGGTSISTRFNTFLHCIFSDDAFSNAASSNTFTNCQVNVNIPSLFVSYTGNTAPFGEDYHLSPAPGNPAAGSGIGGIDLGIYDGSFPYKDNAHPPVPRFIRVVIEGPTDNQGNLPVNITVERQHP